MLPLGFEVDGDRTKSVLYSDRDKVVIYHIKFFTWLLMDLFNFLT